DPRRADDRAHGAPSIARAHVDARGPDRHAGKAVARIELADTEHSARPVRNILGAAEILGPGGESSVLVRRSYELGLEDMPGWDEFGDLNRGYVLELYERFRNDPGSVDPESRAIFDRWTPPASEDAGPVAESAIGVKRAVGAVNLAQSI